MSSIPRAIQVCVVLGPVLGGAVGYLIGRHHVDDDELSLTPAATVVRGDDAGRRAAVPAHAPPDLTAGVVAAQDTTVIAEHESRLLSVEVSAGQAVRAGDVLGRVDIRLLQTELAARAAALQGARARLKKSQVALRSSKTSLERLKRMPELVAKAEVENAGFARAEAAAALEEQKNEVERLTAELQTMRIGIEKASLVAPHDGIVSAVYARVGERLEAGAKILRIVSRERRVRFAFEPALQATVRVGGEGTFVADGSTEKRTVRVVEVADAVDPPTRMIFAEAEFVGDGAGGLLPGVPGHVDLGAGEVARRFGAERLNPDTAAGPRAVRTAGMDLTGWLEYFVEGLSTQLQEVRSKGEDAIRADLLARDRGLNERQATLVAAFMGRNRMSLADCEALLPGVARRTLQRDLKLLIEKELIDEVGHGPTDPTRHYVWNEL